MVTINYRVNIFGSKIDEPDFLSFLTYFFYLDPKSRALDETSLSLLDVRGAVEWVSENIEAFGGDPNNIMVSAAFFNPRR